MKDGGGGSIQCIELNRCSVRNENESKKTIEKYLRIDLLRLDKWNFLHDVSDLIHRFNHRITQNMKFYFLNSLSYYIGNRITNSKIVCGPGLFAHRIIYKGICLGVIHISCKLNDFKLCSRPRLPLQNASTKNTHSTPGTPERGWGQRSLLSFLKGARGS